MFIKAERTHYPTVVWVRVSSITEVLDDHGPMGETLFYVGAVQYRAHNFTPERLLEYLEAAR